MSIRIGLTHQTRYAYDRKVQLGPQTIRLRPAPHTRTPIVSYSQLIAPAEHFLNWQQDPFGNYQTRAVFERPSDHFDVTVDLVADMVAINPFDFFLDEEAFYAPFIYGPELKQDLAPYLTKEGGGTRFTSLASEVDTLWRDGETRDVRTIDFLVELNQLVKSKVDYLVRMDPGVQAPEDTLQKGSGSCRDSAWLLVNLLRHVGLAARFVSGYLIQLAPDERIEGQANGPEQDFTDLHAWAEVFVPGAGWIGLDATSGLFAGEGHIPLAATPAPGSAAPISGGLEPCDVTFDFEMQVTRIEEPARITKPYTNAQWTQIDRLGKAIDAKLADMDVRLTQGGEPTFIATSDRDADEWTIAAVGPTKQAYADALARRLLNRFAKGGLLTHGQGKWYPGEPLPRWAYSIVWRTDSVPLWRNPDRVATEGTSETPSLEAASAFLEKLATKLGVPAACSQPLYEDPAEHLTAEARLPENLSPSDNTLDDPAERARMVRVFDRGLSNPTAFVLPLQQAQADASSGRTVAWMSEIWRTRRERLFLVPGDSPAGFRLPMKSLPWVSPLDYPDIQSVDPFAETLPLPQTEIARQRRGKVATGNETTHQLTTDEPSSEAAPLPLSPTVPSNTGAAPVRTALVIEPRDGHLFIFLPPTRSAEAYCDLIAEIERVAETTGQKVRIEGYAPPNDPRFQSIKVTPDPGVIEVNIHPSPDWDHLTAKTKTLYEEAGACGLDASGFMIDGRPTGSGGGAHITLGGASPPDSPFLRRPDALGSILRFWQNHPSLSYFFSGLFIGPTSQAPRMDEARSDILYEIELALSLLPGRDEAPDVPPWLVDRILRHLLVDVSGNTHRAEICIDKLYSPDGPAGRLGLVEFRAFEMPPHWQMNAAQQLILRALLAWFWDKPYTAPLIDHGTALHDRFMLPDMVMADFTSALRKINDGLGLSLDPAWFAAQFDFRFPKVGTIEQDGHVLEVRNALEPWHVLGEEGAASGTTRFVDSSLERLQVRLTAAPGELPPTVTCNGYRLPLQPGRRHGEQVCGVRFRAWQPASCLHPTIKPHGPLVFDLVDVAAGRAIAGCTVHAVHPGGRNFETRPVNALEAEGRRLARFQPIGHTPGQVTIKDIPPDPRFPFTLDLRRG
ncbi:MAG: transglutaminase family protein [Pseudomonadota bacterium]